MQYITENFKIYKKRLEAGSREIPKKQYPSFYFLIGLLSIKIRNLDELIKTLQFCQMLKHQSKISDDIHFRILNFLFQHPQKFQLILQCLKKLKKTQKSKIKYVQLNDILSRQSQSKHDAIIIENEQILKQTQLQRDFQLACQLYFQQQKQTKNNEKMNQNINIKIETKNDQTNCLICLQNLKSEECFLLQVCSHTYHKKCLIQYYKVQISEKKFPLKCPQQNCKSQISCSNINEILPLQLLNKYHNFTLSSFAEKNKELISCCPTADCGYMFFYQKEDGIRFECVQCLKVYCLKCRIEWHQNMTCEQYKNSQNDKLIQLEDLIFEQFASGKNLKQCPSCKFWVQKNQGCNHMTCRCSYQFCYKCGGKYQACYCVSEKNLSQVQVQNKKRAQNRTKRIEALQKELQKNKKQEKK